jgi:hypothetical protein
MIIQNKIIFKKFEARHQWLLPVNPSYSGGRDQEDCSSKPNSLRDTISEKPITQKGLVEWLKMKVLSSNPFF